MRKIILLCLVLSGCSLFDDKETPQAPIVEEKVQFHPAAPRPIVLNNIEWRVITPTTKEDYLAVEDYSYMCLDWNEYLILGQNMQSIISKFGEYDAILCYYRKDLKEPRCIKYEAKDTETK